MATPLVREIRIAALDVELHEPFGVSKGARPAVENVLVGVVLDDGTIGYGEAAPLPEFNGETRAMAVQALKNGRGSLAGKPISDWLPLTHGLQSSTAVDGRAVRSAACALETALLDAFARSRGVSLLEYFGGRTERLHTDYTITQPPNTDTAAACEHARREARRALELGATDLKIKVGGRDVAEDLQRVQAAATVAPGVGVILDGNAAMTTRDAIGLVQDLRRGGTEVMLLEQPVHKDDVAGLAEVQAKGMVLVAVDESLVDLESAHALFKSGIRAFNVKLMKTGIAASLDIVRFCESNGLELMIGGMVETRLAMTVSAALAAGRGSFRFIDLDTPLFMEAAPFEGGAQWRGAIIDLDRKEPGSGIQPRSNWNWNWE